MHHCDLTEPLVREVLREIGYNTSASWDTLITDLLDLDFPDIHQDSDSFASSYLRYNLLRKWDGDVPKDFDKEGTAYRAFLEAEDKCLRWNELRGSDYDRTLDSGFPLTQSLNALFWRAKEKIRDVLGPFDLNECASHVRFTSGASTRCKRRAGHPFFKYQGRPEVTPDCAMLMICDQWRTPILKSALSDRAFWPDDWVKRVPGGKLAFVPKSYKTYRTIVLEPEGNMRWQTAIGTMIRTRFKNRTGGRTAFGRYTTQDLKDQAPNAHLAEIGSWSDSLSTIDLAAASDSVSLGLVEELLPHDWYRFITMTRSSYVRHPDGSYRALAKVSSMGNGFTFELESLIFWALTASVVELMGVTDQRFRIYGDDIVVSSVAAPRLIQLLRYCGFETNVEKTFVTGPFRESCGSHWLSGVDVSPFYIKEPICTENRYYWFLNTYKAWLQKRGKSLGSYHRCVRLVDKTVRRTVGKRLCVVPPGFGFEAGIELPASKAHIWYSFKRSGYVFTALLPRRRDHKPNGVYALLTALDFSERFESKAPLVERKLRGKGLIIKTGDVSYSRRTRATSAWVF